MKGVKLFNYFAEIDLNIIRRSPNVKKATRFIGFVSAFSLFFFLVAQRAFAGSVVKTLTMADSDGSEEE